MTAERTGRTRAPVRRRLPRALADEVDVDFAEAATDLGCIRALVTHEERAAALVDDGANAGEASEERQAARESEAMH